MYARFFLCRYGKSFVAAAPRLLYCAPRYKRHRGKAFLPLPLTAVINLFWRCKGEYRLSFLLLHLRAAWYDLKCLRMLSSSQPTRTRTALLAAASFSFPNRQEMGWGRRGFCSSATRLSLPVQCCYGGIYKDGVEEGMAMTFKRQARRVDVPASSPPWALPPLPPFPLP